MPIVWRQRTCAMAAGGVGSTNPELLRRGAALTDNAAWSEVFAHYAPFVRARCSVYGLDSALVDEVCQRVWVELARRMPFLSIRSRRLVWRLAQEALPPPGDRPDSRVPGPSFRGAGWRRAD